MIRVITLTCSVLLIASLCPASGAAAPGTLRVTILDAETGQPTACTVAITDASGKLVLEKDSFRSGVRCAGHLAKPLPAGRTTIRVVRGFETRAEERTVQIPAGGEVDLTVSLERVADLRKRGWYSGDSHVHMIHGERTIPVTFDDVALAAKAEDLQYLSLAQDWIIDSPTPEKLEAELGSRSNPDCLLTWNLEAPKNYYKGDAGRCLGHCWNVAVRGRTPEGQNVIDLLMAASAHDYESAKPTYANFESHRLIHSQGGAVFYSHPARWWTGTWGGRGGYPVRENMRISNLAVELPLDTLLGPTYDGVDLFTSGGELENNAKSFQLWCLLLNHGYRVAGTASSDACFDRPGGGTPGVVRTYTYLGDRFSLADVPAATAKGRTFITSGPLLLVSVGGKPPGSAFEAAGQTHTMDIQAWSSGTDPKGLSRIELFRNGQLFRTNLLRQAAASVSTRIPITETEAAWYVVRAYGSDPQRQRAVSGAFFFDPQPFQAPKPVPARVTVELVDAGSGEKLAGSVTELQLRGATADAGRVHQVGREGTRLEVPGTARLRAGAAGYEPLMLSPYLDNPELVAYVTGLQAEDLLTWNTFEHIRKLLGNVRLTFRLHKSL